MKKCTVEGCENKHKAKGYCGKHYAQFKRYGCILERTRFCANEIIEYDDYAEIVLYDKYGNEVNRALIDSEDVERCKEYKWRINDNGYVLTDIKGSTKKLRLHRFIMNCPEDMVVDHINHDRLNNRKSNLRVCTQQQNLMNKKCTGITYDKNRSKWLARITIDNKQKYLGYYETKEEAIEARRQAEIDYFGEFSPNTQD